MRENNSLEPVSLILCADDFAMTKGISLGILELLDAERLSAVSCMTNSDHFVYFANGLKGYSQHADIGLHLVLTDLEPLGEMTRFASHGRFPKLDRLIRMAVLGQLPLLEITEEIKRQYFQFHSVLGRPPQFVDGHHHVHQLPGIRDCLVEFIKQFPVSEQPYIRNCYSPLSDVVTRRTHILRTLGIGFFGKKFKKLLKDMKLQTNDGFSGIYDFSGQYPYEKRFKNFIKGVRNNSILMCHPGYLDGELKLLDRLTHQREVELKFFLGEEFENILLDNGIILSKYKIDFVTD